LSIPLARASTPPHPLIHTPRHTLMAGRTILDPQPGKRASTCVLSTSNQSAQSPSPAAAHSPASEKQSRLSWKITRAAMASMPMGSMPRQNAHVLSPERQQLASQLLSLVTRRIAKENPSCGNFPGVSWVKSPDAYKLTLINKHAKDYRAQLAQYRDFALVPVRDLKCMHFENIDCLDLEQLANNVRIQMLVAIHWLQYTANSFLVFELKQKETDYLFD
jgi:hypothetical protein